MTIKQNLYSCVSKPGEYELIGTSNGAGTMKGVPLIVYRDLQTGHLLHREPENFMARMKKIPAGQSDVNADLLAALEGLVECYCEAGGELSRADRAHHRAVYADAQAVIAKAKGGAA